MSDLWRAVVVQAIRDMGSWATDDGKKPTSDNEARRRAITLEALEWIGSHDFVHACVLAFVDPEELEARLREVVVMKASYRRLMLRDLADMLREPPLRPEVETAELGGELAAVDGDLLG